jgi:hypothetical protein
MADMDSCIPGVCGDVGIDTIVFGTGSFIGMQLCCMNMKRRPALEKLQAFHDLLVEILLEMSPRMLQITGYAISKAGVLVSIFTGRLFSYIDSEHILCKVYICLQISSSSRTISDAPECFNSFTWPQPEECEFWTARFAAEPMKAFILDTYDALLGDGTMGSTYILDHYPHKLHYKSHKATAPVGETAEV